MTVKYIDNRSIKPKSISTLFCIVLAFTMIILGDNMRGAIYDSLIFSLTTIIPTLFPFFILSDLWVSVFYVNPDGVIAKTFEKIFRVNGCAVTSLLSGYICGFPLGVKVSYDLYKENKITKNEFEHLSGFVNNPSLAFVISGVGAGIFRDIRLGIMLYLSVIISSLITGLLFRNKARKAIEQQDNIRQKFILTDSVKNAGLTSLNVISCIIFFSGIIGLISAVIKNDTFITAVSMILEVTNSVKSINANANLSPCLKSVLIAFSLGFSGFSVHLQAFCFMPKEISRVRYLIMKLTQGCICALLILVSLMLTK